MNIIVISGPKCVRYQNNESKNFWPKGNILDFCYIFALKEKADILANLINRKFEKDHECDEKLSTNHIIHNRILNMKYLWNIYEIFNSKINKSVLYFG